MAGCRFGTARWLAFIAALVLVFSAASSEATAADAPSVLHVAPVGDDAGTGSLDHPMRTIGRALQVAGRGAVIRVAAGNYPPIDDYAAHRGIVRVVGPGLNGRRATRRQRYVVRIEGAHLLGARRLRFENVAFTQQVRIASRTPNGIPLRASNITFSGVEFTGEQSQPCIRIDAPSEAVTVSESWIHDCEYGIGGASGPQPAVRIRVLHNVLEGFSGDAIQFGSWVSVRISRNIIRNMHDPAGKIHNDGIQFLGNATHVRITQNEISDSNGQLIFVQPMQGPIDDVLIENNLLHHAAAIAVQLQGVTRATVRANTIWDGHFGGLTVRAGPGGAAASDTMIANNILQTLIITEGASLAYEDHNLVGSTNVQLGPHDLKTERPGFVDAARGDYHLSPRSPAREAGDAELSPRIDLLGERRPQQSSVLGALSGVDR